MRKTVYAVLLLFLLLGSFWGGMWFSGRGGGGDESSRGERKILYYVDPMNPAHTSDKPGPAPCGMPMEPVYADEDNAGGSSSMPPGTAKVTPEKQQMIGIRVEEVKESPHNHTLRTLGKVLADENRIYSMVMGIDGWVWSVKEATTGSLVKKDQLMATVYNYQFLARQQQYLFALDFAERQQAQAQDSTPLEPGERRDLGAVPFDEMAINVPTAPSGLNPTGNVYYIENQAELARLELYNIGVGDYQIKEIARTRQITKELEIRAPEAGIVVARNVSPMQKFDKGAELYRIADLSRVWVLADVFESEAPYVRPGAAARVSLPRQGKIFNAVVTEVPPVFDQTSRSLKVRLDVENPEFELRPDMFVDAEIVMELPSSINVPTEAVLDSGLNRTVFVDLGEGYFEPRQVKTGYRFGDRIEILEGLEAGEKIVVSGNFLIDSESRMKLAAQGLFGAPVKDPVCSAQVYTGKAKASGLTVERDGETHYFCSPECKEQFEAEPHSAEIEVEDPKDGDAASMEKHGFSECPVCSMLISQSKAKAAGLEVEYEGKRYSLCSKYCRNRFLKTPDPYAQKAAAKAQQAGSEQKGEGHD
jgi:multidrug efflux pump subunit AcrA (membrane-fusion protein)/YHS domain-containing protein